MYPFVSTKHLELTNPRLRARLHLDGDQLVIELNAQSLARFVELKLEDAPDVVFSDNYFDVPPKRKIEVNCPLPKGWTIEQARKALKVYSLYSSFTA
ncbi:MAG TPA: hypothetical protein DEH25_08665 [Chloroflexi bacterium]|nr:hypothetical protein [Chloroflexota bacterium]